VPFIESGYNSITNAKNLDIQNIVDKLATKIEKYQAGRTEKGRNKYK